MLPPLASSAARVSAEDAFASTRASTARHARNVKARVYVEYAVHMAYVADVVFVTKGV